MKRLDLRSRLLAGVALVALVQLIVAVVVVSTTRGHLIDQIDDRLAVATGPERRDDGGPSRSSPDRRPPTDDQSRRRERLSDTYEGVVNGDGTLETVFAPNSTGTELAPPDLDLATATDVAGTGPFTIDAQSGDLRYRSAVSATPSGTYLVTAIPLQSVDDTTARLVAVVGASAAAITLALALVTWWVVRLGIRPIKQMTETAGAIAAGRLSERIPAAEQTSEAGRLAVALNQMLGRIEGSFAERIRAEDRLRQFIADASHELRTPVATIRGYAELYRTGGLEGRDDLDDAMRRTEQESLRMTRLVNDMLNLARLDLHRQLLTTRVDLAALVRDAVADATARRPDHPVSTDLTGADLTIDGDEDLLRQALGNVVGNALVHTDAGTPVRVDVHRRGCSVTVAVSDDGPGMTPEIAHRVTERFFRADISRSRQRGGSGLGLAIVDAVVTAHHGTLTIDSTPGVGTTVRLVLPVDGTPSAPPPPR